MTAKKKKIISNVAFYLVLAIIYIIAIYAVITKASGGVNYFFNSRVDVVLTDSMSTKNVNHLDFLKGTSQIQPLDMVVSTNIDENTELKIKDCVLFRNPNYQNKTVVHRIVGITEKGIELEVQGSVQKKYQEKTVLRLDPIEGRVDMGILDFNKIEIVCYSPAEYTSYYNLLQGKTMVTTQCITVKEKEGLYKHTITYKKTSSSPYRTTVAPSHDKEVYLASVTYTSLSKGDIVFEAAEFMPDMTGIYHRLYFPYYLYTIRGDKAAASDGVFERGDLISKVNFVIPKMGGFVLFVQSVAGITILIGLTVIITVASIFWNKNEKKKKEGEIVAETEVIDNKPEIPPEETKEDKKE